MGSQFVEISDYASLRLFSLKRRNYNPEVMPVQCEIIEVAHSEDATDTHAARTHQRGAKTAALPSAMSTARPARACDAVSCAACLAFHDREEHQKRPAGLPQRRRRKSA